jgi:hydrogenase expression/formation protein HypC
MCLAIPCKIVKVNENRALIEKSGNWLDVDISLVPDASVGDFVIVHAGMAIQKYDVDEAAATIALIHEYINQENES